MRLSDNPELVEAERKLRERHSASVKRAAAGALGSIGDVRALEKNGNWQVRDAAAWALGMIKDSRVKEPLPAALEDSDMRVRQRASWALAQIGE